MHTAMINIHSKISLAPLKLNTETQHMHSFTMGLGVRVLQVRADVQVNVLMSTVTSVQ